MLLKSVILVLCFGSASLALPKAKQANCPEIYSRADWGARPPTAEYYMGDYVPYIFIHHSVSPECFSFDDCANEVRKIQNYHMDSNGWCDIGYSFLIGGDGGIYEGRGWNHVGAHTYNFNDVGYGVDFIGDFTDHDPTPQAQDAYLALAFCMEDNGFVSTSYELKGHRQTNPTECPGNYFYETIKSYPHWTDGDIGRSADRSEPEQCGSSSGNEHPN